MVITREMKIKKPGVDKLYSTIMEFLGGYCYQAVIEEITAFLKQVGVYLTPKAKENIFAITTSHATRPSEDAIEIVVHYTNGTYMQINLTYNEETEHLRIEIERRRVPT
jgi:hypothetical protein